MTNHPEGNLPGQDPAVDPTMHVESLDKQLESLGLQTQISSTSLRVGDLVYLTSIAQDEKYTTELEVTAANWQNLQIFATSDVVLEASLSGSRIPPIVANTSMTFTGSEWGGSMIDMSGLSASLSPCFFSKQTGQFVGDQIDFMHVARKNQAGKFDVIDPNQTVQEHSHDIPVHAERLKRMHDTATRLGFDGRDTTPYDVKSAAFEDVLQYIDNPTLAAEAEFTAEGQLKQLSILNKTTNQWYGFEYRNENGEDIMKVATASLSQAQVAAVLRNEIFDCPNVSDALRVAKASATTYVTSPVHGLNARVFRTTPTISKALFDLPYRYYDPTNLQPEAPAIHIMIDQSGALSFDTNNFMYKTLIEENPTVFDCFDKQLSSSYQMPNSTKTQLNESDLCPEPPDVNTMLARRLHFCPGWLKRAFTI